MCEYGRQSVVEGWLATDEFRLDAKSVSDSRRTRLTLAVELIDPNEPTVMSAVPLLLMLNDQIASRPI